MRKPPVRLIGGGEGHEPYHLHETEDLPCVIAIVEFGEGGRLMSNITGRTPDAVRFGMPVRAVFENVADGIGAPKFQLSR